MKMDIIRFLRFCSRGRCGTVLNALLKSKNTVQMSNPELSSLCQLSIAASKAPVVDKVPLLGRERIEFFKVVNQ